DLTVKELVSITDRLIILGGKHSEAITRRRVIAVSERITSTSNLEEIDFSDDYSEWDHPGYEEAEDQSDPEASLDPKPAETMPVQSEVYEQNLKLQALPDRDPDIGPRKRKRNMKVNYYPPQVREFYWEENEAERKRLEGMAKT